MKWIAIWVTFVAVVTMGCVAEMPDTGSMDRVAEYELQEFGGAANGKETSGEAELEDSEPAGSQDSVGTPGSSTGKGGYACCCGRSCVDGVCDRLAPMLVRRDWQRSGTARRNL